MGEAGASGTDRAKQAEQATLSRALRASLLPGEAPIAPRELQAAARYLIEAAARRDAGAAVVAIDSVAGAVGKRLTRIAVVNDNMPFLVDSMAAAITAQGLAIHRLLHPVLPVERGADGALLALGGKLRDGAVAESFVYIETDRADARTRPL